MFVEDCDFHSCDPKFLCCYNAHKDSWNTIHLSKILADIGYSPELIKFTTAEGLATLQGRLYVLIQNWMSAACERQLILASMDLIALDHEVEAATTISPFFKLKTVDPKNVFITSINFYTLIMKALISTHIP